MAHQHVRGAKRNRVDHSVAHGLFHRPLFQAALGSVQLEGATLCLDANSGGGVELAPCGAASTAWGMAADEQVHVGRAGATQTCLQAPPSAAGAGTAPAMKRCIYTGPIPPVSVAAPNFGTQAYVWGPTTAQVVAASSSECLTAGAANLDPGAKGGWVTNNGTLEHEVWMGDLTPLDGAPRRVVALFNKGGSHGASEPPVKGAVVVCFGWAFFLISLGAPHVRCTPVWALNTCG